MGYTPVFNSIFEGSLCGKYPETAAWLFLLALADKNGHVDKSPTYIASVTGMPEADLLKCIEEFCKPDEKSRTADNEGRRLELIDPTRPWGWKIVNHAKYREKARLAAKTAAEVSSGKNRERMDDRRGPPPTAADPLSDSRQQTPNADFKQEAEEAAAFDFSDCPRDMDTAAEHKKFCEWCGEHEKAPTVVRWRRWVDGAKQSGRYTKGKPRPPTEEEIHAERLRSIAKNAAA